MSKHTAVLLLVAALACALLAGCGGKEEITSTQDSAEKGAAFVTLLAEGKFDEAATWFDPTMAAGLPASKLREAWGSLAAHGAYQRQGGTRTATEQGYDVAYVTCIFAQGAVEVKIVLNREGKVSGLWFMPSASG